MDKVLKDFWWGFPTHKSRNYTPIAWHSICQPKLSGGLGIRKMREFNEAFMQKLGWNVLHKPDALWVRLLKAKYFPSSFLLSTAKVGASLTWQGLSSVRADLKSTVCISPRNGGSVDIRVDPWIPHQLGFLPDWQASSDHFLQLEFVADLVSPVSRDWDRVLLAALFSSTTVDDIVTMLPPNPNVQDSLLWTPNPKGIFSVKGAVTRTQ